MSSKVSQILNLIPTDSLPRKQNFEWQLIYELWIVKSTVLVFGVYDFKNNSNLIVDSSEALDSLKSPAKNFIENALKVSFFIRMHSDKSPFGSNLFFDVKYRWQNLEIYNSFVRVQILK